MHGSSSIRGLCPSSVYETSWHAHTLPPNLCYCVLAARNIRVPQLGFGSGQLLLANHVRTVSGNFALFVDAMGCMMRDIQFCVRKPSQNVATGLTSFYVSACDEAAPAPAALLHLRAAARRCSSALKEAMTNRRGRHEQANAPATT